jgi:hypothetical protein
MPVAVLDGYMCYMEKKTAALDTIEAITKDFFHEIATPIPHNLPHSPAHQIRKSNRFGKV